MNAKELLIPRFEVVETYPNCKFKKGDFLERIPNATNDWYNHNKSLIDAEILLEDIEKYPHLFQKLKWWENRTNEEMPKKLICKAIENDTEVMIIEKWDMKNLMGFTDLEKRIGCGLTSFNPDYGYFPVD